MPLLCYFTVLLVGQKMSRSISRKKDTTDTNVEKQFPKPLTVITHHAPAVVLYI